MTSGEHLDPTAEISLEAVKERAVKGVFTLTGRTFILQAVTFVSFIFFGIFLSVEEYGVFILVSVVKNFFAYFSDIGLAAALIQKKDQLSQEELRTTFTIQQLLVVAIIVVMLLTTPLFKQWYGLNQEAVYLLWAFAISLVLSSLKTIPSVILERKLEFGKLVLPQIIDAILFNVIAVTLVWKGFGISSFTVAVLVSGFISLVAIYIIQPWRPGFAFSKNSLKGLFRFGLPYQTNTFLAVLKDDGLTAVLGGILGPGGISLYGWAKKWASAPLRFFMDQVIKVTFPAYSRMQENKDELSRALSKSILFVTTLVFPSLVGLVLLVPLLTEIVPRYEKWQPALIALTLFSINSVSAAVVTPLTNMLNAIGKITVTFKLMIMWTSLSWIFIPVLAFFYGLNGAALGSVFVEMSSIIAILVVVKFVKVDFFDSVIKPFLASIIMGVAVYSLREVLPVTWPSVILLITIGIFIYLPALILLAGVGILTDAKKAFLSVKKR